MSGKPREDRASVASHHLGLRFTAQERAALQAVTDDMNSKLATLGLPAAMTGTSVIRWLIAEEVKRRSLSTQTLRSRRGKG